MQKIVTALFFFFLCIFCFSQSKPAPLIPKQTKHDFNWGKKSTRILLSQYGKRKDIVFLNLHDNESTSVDATKMILEETGGLLIEIENNGDRLISFEKNRKQFQFDPNRIFTQRGLRENLRRLNGHVTTTASNSVKAFSKFVLQQIPKSALILVALHNNDDGEYSIDSYKPNGNHAKDAARFYINPAKDPDNFLLVTTAKMFNALKMAEYNAVLQNNSRARDDGSLSIYYGQRKKVYVNIEAEHGQIEEQSEMVKVVIKKTRR